MSQTLQMVKQELLGFQNGEIGLDAMWDRIDSGLLNLRKSRSEAPDPYEDDKAERRVVPRHLGNGSTAN